MKLNGGGEGAAAGDKGQGHQRVNGGVDSGDRQVRPRQNAHDSGDRHPPQGRTQQKVQWRLARVRRQKLRIVRHLRSQPLHLFLHRTVRIPTLQNSQKWMIETDMYWLNQ